MLAARPDPLAEALNAATRGTAGVKQRITTLFGDRPDVLESITTARKRGVSCAEISKIIKRFENEQVSVGAIKTYLHSVGVE